MTNKEWLEKYPWLRGYDPYPEENDSDINSLEWLPEGWVKAFGEEMCEDLDRVIKSENLQDEFRIIEAKEKYGQIRLYCDPCIPAIQDVLRVYEACSEVICVYCGSIENVKFTNFGWCQPCCKSCFEKTSYVRNIEKFNALPTEKLPTVVKWSRCSKNGTEHFEVDISETVEKIRERYNARKASGEFEVNDFEEDENYYGA